MKSAAWHGLDCPGPGACTCGNDARRCDGTCTGKEPDPDGWWWCCHGTSMGTGADCEACCKLRCACGNALASIAEAEAGACYGCLDR